MIRLLWRTDLHLSDRTPQSRTDDWTEAILGKIRKIGDIAREVGAAGVIDGGDFFHTKTPSRNPHHLVEKAARAHEDYPCPVWCNIGNHDCKYADYTLVDENPLGVLFSTGVFNRLYDEHEAIFTTPEGLKVRVVGIPYHGVRYDMERFHSIKKGDEDWLVVVAHVLASPAGGKMFEGEDIVKYGDLLETDADVYCFGHWHMDQGVQFFKKPNGDELVIVNVGSGSRGALTEDEMTREPKVIVMRFDAEDLGLGQVTLDVRPADEVFDIEGRVRAEGRQMMVEAFVESLKDALQGQEGADLAEEVRQWPNIDDQVRERAVGYLEEAQI